MVYITPGGWVVIPGDKRAEKEIRKPADDLRADLLRITDLVEHYGLEALHEPHVKHLQGKLWEMRLRGQGWYCPRCLCYRTRKTCRYLACIREKDAENAARSN